MAQHFGFPKLAYASPLWYEFTDVLFRGLEQTLTLKVFRGIDDLHYRYAVLRGFEPIPFDSNQILTKRPDEEIIWSP